MECAEPQLSQIASGVMLGVAILLAFGRTYIKLVRCRYLFVDDWLFILANILLVAGTIVIFLALPYSHAVLNVEAGVEAPSPDLIPHVDLVITFQATSLLLLYSSIYSVKFSFLLFFRLLLQGTGKLRVWWWLVFIFTIPCAILCICGGFIACPAVGGRIISE